LNSDQQIITIPIFIFMDVFTAIQKRRSIRHFQQKTIPKELEKKLIGALIWAPSAGNLQSRKFYFIKDEIIKEKLVKSALYQDFVFEAPLVVVACINIRIEKRYGGRGKNLYTICDVAVALQNLMLQATGLGLGTCWVGTFDEKKVKEILEIPKYLRPIAVVPVGFSAESPEVPPRVEESETIEYK